MNKNHISRNKIKEYESHTLSSKIEKKNIKVSFENKNRKLLDYLLHFIVVFELHLNMKFNKLSIK